MYYGVACNVTLQYMHPVHLSLFLDTLDSSSSKVKLGISVFCQIIAWKEMLISQSSLHSICALRYSFPFGYSFHFIVETIVLLEI